MMGWHRRARDFTWEDYLGLLPQFRRMSTRRPALVLPWVQDGLEDWPSALARARRLVGSMTLAERLEPEGITQTDRERIGLASETDPIGVEQLLSHFLLLRDHARRYQTLSFWQRIKWLRGNGILSGR